MVKEGEVEPAQVNVTQGPTSPMMALAEAVLKLTELVEKQMRSCQANSYQGQVPHAKHPLQIRETRRACDSKTQAGLCTCQTAPIATKIKTNPRTGQSVPGDPYDLQPSLTLQRRA